MKPIAPQRVAMTFIALLIAGCTSHAVAPPRSTGLAGTAVHSTLNPYILKAVESLAHDYGNLGYGDVAFTHDLTFGNQGLLPASSRKPLTMCVAAQLEVLVEALDGEAAQSHNYRAFAFLPKASWERLRPTDFRGQIWTVEGAEGHGMADALTHMGMGAQHPFEALQPGDFINFNRTNGSGHGAVFLGYLDSAGNALSAYSGTVTGFKYFSSQGKAGSGGLGYRYAFFSPTCPPPFTDGRKRDCGVIRSNSARLLNGGSAWLPAEWNSTQSSAFVALHRRRGEADGTFNAVFFSGVTTDD